MKNTITLFILLAVTISSVASQTISESLINLTESYKPIFATESAIVSMNFVKFYDIDQPDTTYRFIIEVTNKSIEVENLGYGMLLLNTPTLLYELSKNQDHCNMNYDEFIEFYDCLSKVYHFISQKAAYKTDKKNLVATCGSSNVFFGGEYKPGSFNENKVATFYLKVGENTTYEMKKHQFESITRTLTEIKAFWATKQ